MSAAQQVDLSPDVAAFVMRAKHMSDEAHAVLTAAFGWALTHKTLMTMADYRAMNESHGVTEAVGYDTQAAA